MELSPDDYAPEVIDELEPYQRRDLWRTAGPAIPYAGLAVIVRALLWLLTPLFEYAAAECPAGAVEGVVEAPFEPFVIAGFLFVIVWWYPKLQDQCLKYVIIPQLQVTQGFKFLGCSVSRCVGYSTWRRVFHVTTVLTLMNTMTNGQIMGRIWATWQCGFPYDALEAEWGTVMGQVWWASDWKLPFFEQSSFLRFALLTYALPAAIPIFALIYACPLEPTGGYNVKAGAKAQYRTPYNCTPTDHGAVAMVLASLASFEAVTFQANAYATTRIEDLAARNDMDGLKECLTITRTELDRSIARFLVIALLQDAVQTNFQITVVGIDWLISREDWCQRKQCSFGGVDPMMMVSACLNLCINTPNDFLDALDVVKIVWSSWRRLRPHKGELTDHDLQVYNSIYGRGGKLARFCVYLFVFILLSLWSLAKFVALFRCDSHLWNFRPIHLLLHFDFDYGCA